MPVESSLSSSVGLSLQAAQTGASFGGEVVEGVDSTLDLTFTTEGEAFCALSAQ